MLIRTLGQAAVGRIAPQDVVLLLGYIALGHLPTMLALSLFIAVVATLARMYRDSEMTIWFASGVGAAALRAPGAALSWPVLLVVGVLALFVWPWVNQRSAELQGPLRAPLRPLARGAGAVPDLERRPARVLHRTRCRRRAQPGRNVFILSQPGRAASRSPRRAAAASRLEGDDRFLVLDRGQRNEENLQHRREDAVALRELPRRWPANACWRAPTTCPPKARPTLDCCASPTPPNHGELVWRLGLVLGAANLVLLGIGLSASNPRHASNWNLLFALLTLRRLLQPDQPDAGLGRRRQARHGRRPWWAHGSALALALALLWWRDHAHRRAGAARTGRGAWLAA